MSDVFISHVEEDTDIVLQIAQYLETKGYSTWHYTRDSLPGTSYLLQTGEAIEQSQAVILLISPHAVLSQQVTREVERAHESGKPFVPVLHDITHAEFQNRQPEWRQAVGAAVSIPIPPEGVASILPRIIAGLNALGIQPKQSLGAETTPELDGSESQFQFQPRERAPEMTTGSQGNQPPAGWLATSGTIGVMALVLWLYFSMTSSRLTPSETLVVVVFCIAVVLTLKWGWVRLRQLRSKK